MMRKITIVLALFCIALISTNAQQRVEITIKYKDKDNGEVKGDTIYNYIGRSDSLEVFFSPYFNPLPDSIGGVDMGFGVKWSKSNYSKKNNNGTFNAFKWSDSNMNLEWAQLYGQDWRVPTKEDFELLIDSEYCEWNLKYDDPNALPVGFDVISKKTEKTISLFFDQDQTATYWSKTEYDTDEVYCLEISFDPTAGENGEGSKKVVKRGKNDGYWFIRPVYGEPINQVKVSIAAEGNSYQSGTVSVKIEKMPQDFKECDVYWDTTELALPSKQNANSTANYKSINIGTDGTGSGTITNLISGQQYYVCAVVKTTKGNLYYSAPSSFRVNDMSVTLLPEAKNVETYSAAVTLSFQANPLSLVNSYTVVATSEQGSPITVTMNDNLSVNTVDIPLTGLQPQTTYTCTATVEFNSKKDIPALGSVTFTTKSAKPINTRFPVPDAGVDLGCNVLWSPYNIGAKDENDGGGYFYGWGDPDDVSGTMTLTEDNPTAHLNPSLYAESQFIEDIAATKYDIATKQWESEWRMPSRADWHELYTKCNFVAQTRNGVYGYVVSNKTGTPANSIFLPMSGSVNYVDRQVDENTIGSVGFYWTSESSYQNGLAYRLRLASIENEYELKDRYVRCCIRPVYGPKQSGGEIVNPPIEDPTDDPRQVKEEKAADGSSIPCGAIDLRLPSGVKWAPFDVGSMKYGEIGKYYAWGDTETRSRYTMASYSTSDYWQKSVYRLDDKDDVAQVLWQEHWRMPTQEDLMELMDNTDKYWVNQIKDINGNWIYQPGLMLVSKSQTDTLFLPAGGSMADASFQYKNIYGRYWSNDASQHNGKTGTHAIHLLFMESDVNGSFDVMERFIGCNVRPIWVIPVTELRNDGNNIIEVEIDKTFQLPFTVVPSDATNTSVTYSFDPEFVEQISGKYFKGKAVGNCTIQVTANDRRLGIFRQVYTINVKAKSTN